jgi:SAM-dependent MidA family methyltransferase
MGLDAVAGQIGHAGQHDDQPSVMLSNELVDAFPVHVVETRNRDLYEVYVDVHHGRLHEVLDEPSIEELVSYLEHYKIPWQTFDNGWRAEINLDALHWMESTTQRLLGTGKRKRHGYLLTIDYGDKAPALYTRHRQRGTLTCYFQHQLTGRPLARPGEQDITAHVNFSALIAAGRTHGLRLHKFTTQRQWLESMGIYDELEQLRSGEFALADTARATNEGQIALLQWRTMRQKVATLTDSISMGDFKVLVMYR